MHACGEIKYASYTNLLHLCLSRATAPQVEHALLRLSPDAFVDMAAFQILDSCWLALLLRQKSDGLLKFVPTQALQFKTLSSPNSSMQQV